MQVNRQTSAAEQVSSNFISGIKASYDSLVTNYTGALSAAFSAIASAGAAGCGFEQHIEAAKRALNNNPANAGFLLPTAFLAIVIIADEDDCSMEHTTLLPSDTSQLGPLQSFRCTRYDLVGGHA